MKRESQRLMAVICLLALMPVSSYSFAQSGNITGKSPVPIEVSLLSAGTFKYFEAKYFSKVVKGAPYSANAITEHTQTLSDGNQIIRKKEAKVYRDGAGRTRFEQKLDTIGKWTASGDAPQMVYINDPVSGFSYNLDPNTRTVRKSSTFKYSTLNQNDDEKRRREQEERLRREKERVREQENRVREHEERVKEQTREHEERVREHERQSKERIKEHEERVKEHEERAKERNKEREIQNRERSRENEERARERNKEREMQARERDRESELRARERNRENEARVRENEIRAKERNRQHETRIRENEIRAKERNRQHEERVREHQIRIREHEERIKQINREHESRMKQLTREYQTRIKEHEERVKRQARERDAQMRTRNRENELRMKERNKEDEKRLKEQTKEYERRLKEQNREYERRIDEQKEQIKFIEQRFQAQEKSETSNSPVKITESVAKKEISNSDDKKKIESLGKQTIEGVEVEGTRSTRAISAGEIGNTLPIDVVDESWYSPDLQVLVMTRHNDPRSGVITYRLSNIRRSEPERVLFEIPADYIAVQEKKPVKIAPIKEPAKPAESGKKPVMVKKAGPAINSVPEKKMEFIKKPVAPKKMEPPVIKNEIYQ
jgi:hypothetical protein